MPTDPLAQRVAGAGPPGARSPDRRAWLATALAVLGAAGPVAAGPCRGEGCVAVRPGDEVLLVSVRRLGCSTDPSRFRSGVDVERLLPRDSGGHAWVDTTLDDLLGSIRPETPTVVFAHGNRVEENEVRPRGLWVYRRLVDCRGDDRPLRFVLFSWPSDEIDGLVRDARAKAARALPAGYQLAWLLAQAPPEAPIGLFGYSFGARVQSTAAHLLAGGRLGGLALPAGATAAKRRVSAVYVAPAIDADWLGPGRRHGQALQTIDHLLLTVNPADPAMRFFRFINPNKRPKSLGYAGPTRLSADHAGRVRCLNVRKAVGRTHDMCAYMRVNGLMRRAWRRLLHAPPPGVAVAASAGAGNPARGGARR